MEDARPVSRLFEIPEADQPDQCGGIDREHRPAAFVGKHRHTGNGSDERQRQDEGHQRSEDLRAPVREVVEWCQGGLSRTRQRRHKGATQVFFVQKIYCNMESYPGSMK